MRVYRIIDCITGLEVWRVRASSPKQAIHFFRSRYLTAYNWSHVFAVAQLGLAPKVS